MRRTALIGAVGIVVTFGPRPVTADPIGGPFHVMGPDEAVVRISSEDAEAWWLDYRESRCVTCRAPHQAAELLDAVETGLGSRFRAGPRYLVLVESLRSTWPRAWIFYPSSDETTAYVVHPGGVGSGVASLRWDAWYPATSRMERIIVDATRATSSPTAAGAVEESGGGGAGPVAWIAASVVFTALLLGFAVARGRGAPRAVSRSGPADARPRRGPPA